MILLGIFICLLALGLFTTSLTNPYHEPETEVTCIFLLIIGIVCMVVGIGTFLGFWDIEISKLLEEQQ